MSYKVTSPLVVMPNADGISGDGYFYQDAVIPGGFNDERSQQLAKEGMLEHFDAPEVDEDADVVLVESDPFTDEQLAEAREGNVDAQLDAVGDNPAKAQQVLDAEMELPEDKRRKTLLAGLQDVLDAAEAAPEGAES